MKNIEIKVAIKSKRNIIKCLKKLGANYKGRIKQIDTYYNSQSGRLKIREIDQKESELIFYQRPDKSSSKISHYQRLKINKKELPLFKKILDEILGKTVIVRKMRQLWIYKNTRIHLDNVKGLGNFVELETVIKGREYNKFEKEHEWIKEALPLTTLEVQDRSYSDLLIQHLSGVV